MAYTELSLPTDIPWKRLAVSKDMVDRPGGDFPKKWRSSIAIFYYEPDDLPPEHCDRQITYLKISCTLTSYQLEGEDVTILDELREYGTEFWAWKDFESQVTDAFPCHGCLLQVGVYAPRAWKGPALPYIAALEPQKREMYEVVTESGEMLSQSSAKIDVSKGAMSTKGLEKYDLDLGGGSWTQNYGYRDEEHPLASESQTNPQRQQGQVGRSQVQDQHVTTTDSSREKRESLAFSSTVNHVYSLLESYHVGTNRAVFLMQPRPRIQQSRATFIRGLRRLEGIQEFFLIVERPREMRGLCVEIALETAHAYLYPSYEPRVIPLHQLFASNNLAKTAMALGIDVAAHYYYERFQKRVDTWNNARPSLRHVVHGAATQSAVYMPKEIQQLINDQKLTIEQWWELRAMPGLVPDLGLEDVALIFEETVDDIGRFFLTGRRLHACYTSPPKPRDRATAAPDASDSGAREEAPADASARHPEEDDGRWQSSIVFEAPIDAAARGSSSGDAHWQNQFLDRMQRLVRKSVGSPQRHAYGQISFMQSDFVLDRMAHMVRLFAKIEGYVAHELTAAGLLGEELASRLPTNACDPIALLSMSSDAFAHTLRLPLADAKLARASALRAALKSADGTVLRRHTSRVDAVTAAQIPIDAAGTSPLSGQSKKGGTS